MPFPDGIAGPADDHVGKELKQSAAFPSGRIKKHGLCQGVATTVGGFPVATNMPSRLYDESTVVQPTLQLASRVGGGMRQFALFLFICC